MKNLLLIILLFTGLEMFAQGAIVNGNVLDGEYENEPLAFARIKVKGLDISTETSMSGYFEFRLLQGNYDLIVEFIGYDPVEIKNIEVTDDKLNLKPVILKSHHPEIDLASASKEEISDEKSE